ncbi:MAG: M20/M25/M40 family metallo-hydrolase, partial [Deferribacteraceae bacterium]|jgi:succinyl-diaminopimelate desuccinylase|nr:M20/M25/M40 family metallo-hydrolase [Deferribacteraceae bacterium]
VPADTPFVQTLISAYEEVTGEKGHAVSTGGGTYCREMPNSVSFGMAFPNEEEMAHQIDEYVYLDSLRTAVNIYVAAITKMSL